MVFKGSYVWEYNSQLVKLFGKASEVRPFWKRFVTVDGVWQNPFSVGSLSVALSLSLFLPLCLCVCACVCSFVSVRVSAYVYLFFWIRCVFSSSAAVPCLSAYSLLPHHDGHGPCSWNLELHINCIILWFFVQWVLSWQLESS